jgi:DnaJ like chaperone protein
MAGFGKWIGGGLGWAFGGPIGAFLGFTLGSMFDKAQHTQDDVNPSTGRSNTMAGDFAASLLVLSAAVMKADGKVLKSELDYVKRFFTQQFGQDKAANYILDLREILKQEIPVRDVALQIRDYMDHSSRLQLYHYLWGIAMADNILDPSEENLLIQLANYLRISQYDYQSIKAMHVKDVDNDYKILELSPDASVDEIKKSYRKLAIKYHPDKVSHLGEDYKKAAEEKFQKLNEAYDNIKKQRGFH